MKNILTTLTVALLSLSLVGQKFDIPLDLRFGMSKKRVESIIRENGGYQIISKNSNEITYLGVPLRFDDRINESPVIRVTYSNDSLLYDVGFEWTCKSSKDKEILNKAFEDLRSVYILKYSNTPITKDNNKYFWFFDNHPNLLFITLFQDNNKCIFLVQYTNKRVKRHRL